MCTTIKKQINHYNSGIVHTFIRLAFKVLKFVFIQIHWFIDYIIDIAFGLYYDSKATKVPPIKNKLLLESAVNLAKKISIPISNDLRIKWFDAIGRKVSKNSAVCDMHFEEKDFVYKIISGKIKRFLLPGVAPTKDCHYYSENINRPMTSWRNCSLISESQSTQQVESSHQQSSDSCINCIEVIHENNTIAIQPSLKREKDVSAEEVVTAFIERCKEVNEVINAIVDERYEDAIKEAKKVDQVLLDKGINIENLENSAPLLGVPFTTKESNEAKGMLHSMGTLSRRGYRSLEDASVIEYVKKAGAIIIAKTNIPELNQWIESRNKIYGQTNNPYNTTCTVGGSSGGDAAIVTACGVPFAVGSDIGGSIRIPASYNGIFGLKPSEGMTNLKGIGLRKQVYLDSMAEAGPLCKRAEDLELLIKIISGPFLKNSIDKSIPLKFLNIFYQENSQDIRASKLKPSAHNVLIKAVRHLEQVTKSVKKIKLPGSEYSYRLWRYWMTQEAADFNSDLTNNIGRTSAGAEIYKLLKGNGQVTLAAILKLIDHDFLPQENAKWATSMTNKMKTYLVEKLGDNGVFLYPAFNSAKYHYASFISPFSFGYWAIFNVLKVPVCQVPMGLDENGLPLGIQIVAAPGNDQLCIAVAKELEVIFGGWVPPS